MLSVTLTWPFSVWILCHNFIGITSVASTSHNIVLSASKTLLTKWSDIWYFWQRLQQFYKNFLWLSRGVTQQQKNSVGHVQIAENIVKHRVWCLIFLICQIYCQNDVLFNKQKKIKDITLTIIKCVIPLWQKTLCSTHPQVLYYIIYRRKWDIPFEIMWGSLEILNIFHSFAWATFQLFGKLQLLFVSLSFIADLLCLLNYLLFSQNNRVITHLRMWWIVLFWEY